ncbi:hypothetical protein Ddc_01438 [Ditylenchus destructor]|nr:hypothetical protein Ddc_01438 [Ditylenchus destructor]
MSFGTYIPPCDQICSTLAPLFSNKTECLEERRKVEERQSKLKGIITQNNQGNTNSVRSKHKIQDVIKVEASVRILGDKSVSIPSAKQRRKELTPEALAAKRAKDAERQRRRRAKLFGEAMAAEKAMNTVNVLSGETESLPGYSNRVPTNVTLGQNATQANQLTENFTIERGFSYSNIKLEIQDELCYEDQAPACSTEVNSDEQLNRYCCTSVGGTGSWREKCFGAALAIKRENRNDSLQECSSSDLNAIDFGDIFAQVLK